MKKYFLTYTLILFSIICFAQDKQAIIKVMAKQQQDWNRGDIDGFMQSYWKSDSLMFMGKNGPNYGWQNTLDHYKKSYPNKAAMGQLIFKIIKVDVLDKTNAFVLGAWNLKRDKNAPGGYFTLWFKKFNGVWKIVADHTS